MPEISELLEIAMIISFGISWPINVKKSYVSRTAKGKSVAFLYLILAGYIAGISAKLLNSAYLESIGSKWYILFFYVLNFLMVSADLVLYYRNKAIDAKNAEAEKNKSINNESVKVSDSEGEKQNEKH